MDALRHDILFALRVLRKDRTYAVAVIRDHPLGADLVGPRRGLRSLVLIPLGDSE